MKIHNLWWKYNIFLYSFKAFERFVGEKFTKKKNFYSTFDKKHIIISEWKERHVKHKKMEACKGMRECLTDKETENLGVLKIHSEPNYKYIFKVNLQYFKKNYMYNTTDILWIRWNDCYLWHVKSIFARDKFTDHIYN